MNLVVKDGTESSSKEVSFVSKSCLQVNCLSASLVVCRCFKTSLYALLTINAYMLEMHIYRTVEINPFLC